LRRLRLVQLFQLLRLQRSRQLQIRQQSRRLFRIRLVQLFQLLQLRLRRQQRLSLKHALPELFHPLSCNRLPSMFQR
jgi:hypothetical protein